MTPTNQQNFCLGDIKKWYHHGSSPFFYLAGFAGTGKSFLAKFAAESCGLDPTCPREVLYAAYTGKAAMVLRRKGLAATTIHDLIYHLVEVNGEGRSRKLVFETNPRSDLRYAKLLILDECSMISENVARDIMSFGTKILVLGDPGQLPPPKSAGFFINRKPDFFLDEIHRQALNNPIIQYAHEVRSGKEIPFGTHGTVRKIKLDDYDIDEFTNVDQILTGTHKLRHELNHFMLQAEGHDVNYPYTPGIKVLCMRNYRGDRLYNGMIGRTMDFVDPIDIDDVDRGFYQRVHIEDGETDEFEKTKSLKMNFGEFQDTWDERSDKTVDHDARMIEAPSKFTDNDQTREMQYSWAFGYAITVHKAQGSQWNNLCICDNGHLGWNRTERSRWLYTALTRAVDKCDLVMV